MALSSLVRNTVLKLPRFLRDPMIRRMIRFPQEISTDLRFKVAETQDELEQAFKLLHDAYVKEGLMTPHPSGMRVTKYHILPSTTTLIAVQGDKVVGTVSLVRKNAFGLPLEAIFDVDGLPPGSRAAEVSSLAILDGMRNQRGRILFPLLKFMYHYSTHYFGVTHYLIAVNPKWYTFYEAVLLFTRLSAKTVEKYDFVNGAPAIGGILNIKRAPMSYAVIYGEKKGDHNLSHFFQDLEPTNMEFPLRKRSLISDPVLTPDMMKHFFMDKTSVMESFSDFELSVVNELYSSAEYQHLLPKPKVTYMKERKTKRFDTSLNGRVHVDETRSVRLDIQTVSASGVGGIMSTKLPTGPCTLRIDIEDHQPCVISGEIMWVTPAGQFGFKIDPVATALVENTGDHHVSWQRYIDDMNERLIGKRSATSTAMPLNEKRLAS